ncbi:uncharacterized protein LOC135499916 [Lineus longissimus]|uniref:uncharacterized protein LOC135499916 n=1 Tax=Lineus longissimus TaxID=88925 RepID=UPI002B4D835D
MSEDKGLGARRRQPTLKGLDYNLDVKRRQRKESCRFLRLMSDKLIHHLTSEDVTVGVIHKEYSVWLTSYEEFLGFHREYQSLLSSDEERAKDNEALFLKHDSVFRDCKTAVEAWLLEHDKPPSTRRSGSVRSHSSSGSKRTNISYSKMQEATKKAELLAKVSSLEKKRTLERKRIDLQIEEEELIIKTEMAVCDAKTQVLEEFEQKESLFAEATRRVVFRSPPSSLVQPEGVLVSVAGGISEPVMPSAATASVSQHVTESTVTPALAVPFSHHASAPNVTPAAINMPLPSAQSTVSRPVPLVPVLMSVSSTDTTPRMAASSMSDHDNVQETSPISLTLTNGISTVLDPHTSVSVNPPSPVARINKMPSLCTPELPQVDCSGVMTIMRELKKPAAELHKFSGNPMEYARFIRSFNARINAYTDSYEEKMNYLLQYTMGEAHKIVSGYSNLEAKLGYQAVSEEFQERYGDSDVVSQAYVKKALSWPSIRSDNAKGLDEYSIFLRECLYAVENVSGAQVLDYSENLKLLVKKLPVHLHDRWRNIVFDVKGKDQVVRFSHLVAFVRREARKAIDPTYGRDVLSSFGTSQASQGKPAGRAPSGKQEHASRAFATNAVENKKPAFHTSQPGSRGSGSSQRSGDSSTVTNARPAFSRPCMFCNSTKHAMDGCCEMVKLNLKDRYAFLRSKGLCYGCLELGHQRDSCNQKLTCLHCNRPHPSVLHLEPRSNPVSSSSVTLATASSRDMGAGDSRRSAMAIVPVKVRMRGGNKCVETYALLDSGSTASFCTMELMKSLGVKGRKTKINIRTMGHEILQNSYVISDLEVVSFNENIVTVLPPVFTQLKLPVDSDAVVTSEDIQKWSYLKDIPLHTIDSDVELLIGVNVPMMLQPLEVVPSQDNGPFAVRTAFGWVINGPLAASDDREEACGSAVVNRTEVRTIASLEDQIRDHVDRDFSERVIDDEIEPSQNDKLFLERVSQSITFVDGHYIIGLPFKDMNTRLPNNRPQAVQRMESLKRKFRKDSDFHDKYKTFMDKILSNDYARVAPYQPPTGKVWYLPHHGVFHPKKQKLRVVFDCSARYGGTSLNDHLLQGPNLTNSLPGTLLRFREEEIAMMADIESMFYRVRVPDEDANYLRFLWWEDGDPSKSMVEHQMMVHIFGAASSPSCANYALRRTAEDNRGEFPEAAKVVERNFYVDDCLKSKVPTAEAITLAEDLHKLCWKGGFNLTAYISNNREVMASIPVEYWAKEVKDLDLQKSSLPMERALGVQWCVQSDTFNFKIEPRNRPPTRRGILSTVYSIYDPLGFLSPVILKAKCLLQELCRLKLSWDEDIPEPHLGQWSAWLEDVTKLADFSIRRCVKPEGFGELASAECHHFSDASESGYGVATYLRLINTEGHVHCGLVQAKSRVTPLKQVTIVRLELTAATVAVKIDTMLRKEFEIPLQKSHFWTDSMSVIKYIRNETSGFHTFVANRLQVIHEGSDVKQWRYISSALNPADEASRGQGADAFLQNRRWLNGPDFLWESPESWPIAPPLSTTLSKEDHEVKRSVVAASNVQSATPSSDSVDKLISFHSSWYTLKRAVAWILRVKEMLAHRVRSRNDGHRCKPIDYLRPLTVQDLKESECAILRFSQQAAFAEEMKSLASGRACVKQSSSLRKLDPVLDNGLLHVGGRLSRSALPVERKSPVILPKNSHVSRLILRQIHAEVMHEKRNHMLSRLNEKYWLIHAQSAIRKIIAKCVECRKREAKVGEQKMSDLPQERLTVDEPPFTSVGCDLFGPFEVKRGRAIVKRYGVLFTCMTIRAVHLEIADSLDTDSYINAMRRFIARRGQVKRMRSDNGTNLTSGERELRGAIKAWNKAQIHEFLLQQNIVWVFNPPLGSHHGGVFERQIRTVRKCLNSVLNEQRVVNEESLRTLMCEVEAIVNDRPITRISDQCNDLEALTPNMLLTMKVKPRLPPGLFSADDNYGRRRWRQVQYMSDLFWRRWSREYLTLLQERQKWTSARRNLKVGDIVLLVDDRLPRNLWPLGRVIETMPDRQGYVRSVKVKTQTNVLIRPISKLIILLEMD